MNSLSTKVTNKQMQAFNQTMQNALSTQGVNDLPTATLKLNTALAIQDKTKLPMCKLLSIVKNKELFKHSEKHNKNFEIWAKNHYNMSKASVFKYAKAGDFVDDSGFNTIFAEYNENNEKTADFDYSALVRLVELCTIKDGKTIDEEKTTENIKNAINNGIIVVGMSAREIEKAFKPAQDDITDDTQIIDENTENDTASENENDTASENQQPEYNPINAIKDTNFYKFSLSIFESALIQIFNDNASKDGLTLLEYMQNIIKSKAEK